MEGLRFIPFELIMKHNLSEDQNYKQVSDFEAGEAMARFSCLLAEYEAAEMDHKRLSLEAWKVGVESITHVFSMLLMYTKNLDLTAHHTQRAVYYYVQFMTQIDEEPNGFLKLAARDAMMFVLKKTVFEVSTARRQEFACPVGSDPALTLALEGVQLLSSIYRDLVGDRSDLCRAVLNCSLGCEYDVHLKRLRFLTEATQGLAKLGKRAIPVLIKSAKLLRRKRSLPVPTYAGCTADDAKTMTCQGLAQAIMVVTP